MKHVHVIRFKEILPAYAIKSQVLNDRSRKRNRISISALINKQKSALIVEWTCFTTSYLGTSKQNEYVSIYSTLAREICSLKTENRALRSKRRSCFYL